MKTLIIWVSSFLLAGVIVSPFFWLKFLKKKSAWAYVFWSSLVTIALLLIFTYPVDDFLNSWTAKINADLYYVYYEIGQYALYIVLLLIILFPFIFTKIIYGRIKVRSFFISLFLSIIIFISLFLFWVYVLLPIAFSKLHTYF
jgi:hypothetical protein